MAASTPVVRSISWGAAIVQIAIVIGAALLGSALFKDRDPSLGVMIGAACCLVYYRFMRRLLVNDHRRGIVLVRQQQFADAVPCFEASYEFMRRHPWADRWRCLLVGSASATSYREMALCNIAFCYSQMGEGDKALACYERAIGEFPDCAVATAALKMMRSAQLAATDAR
ncbi:MAG TPA: tetratricopeptide repeat protein [Pirellulales bacterium]|jgi:tetratricopeptide (TPR) repeat protein